MASIRHTIYAAIKSAEKTSDITKKYGSRARQTTSVGEKMTGMDDMPLPDLYLVDSRKLSAEVCRIRGLVLAIPMMEATHAATQSVVDALWRLERDMAEIQKVQAQIHSSFGMRGEALAKADAPPRIGLKVVQ